MSLVTIIPYIDYLKKHSIQTTYAELVDLINDSSLSAGSSYTIMDYDTITNTSTNVSSGLHPFNIMVVADSSNSLNAKALAIDSSRDTSNYFQYSDLSKWELKYDVSNNLQKYYWADPVNGKGVIYYMKDEHNNECGYDFKNIMYKGSHFNVAAIASSQNKYPLIIPNNKTFLNDCYYYTFAKCSKILDSNGQPMDGNCCLPDPSVDMSVQQLYWPYDNKINTIMWYGADTSHHGAELPYNIVASDPSSLGASSRPYGNIFENCATNNILCNSYFNNFAPYAHLNYLGNCCTYNEFQGGVQGCLLNNNCRKNILGFNADGIILGEESRFNSFGDNCYDITLGEIVQYTTFEGNNRRIDMLKTGGAMNSKGYARYNTVKHGIHDVSVLCSATLAATNQLQNYEFGISGLDASNPYVIDLALSGLNKSHLTRYVTHKDDEVVCANLTYLTLANVGLTAAHISIKYKNIETDVSNNLDYRIVDDGTYDAWEPFTTNIEIPVGKSIQLCGKDGGIYSRTSTNYYSFNITDSSIAASGNIMSLISSLMDNSLPATCCFEKLFYNLTNLISAPELPATTLADSCYSSMFYGCTSLTQAPELPATTLADSCYLYMFSGCTSLTQAPELPATTLAYSCYFNMFYGTNVLPDTSHIDFTSTNNGGLRGLFAGTKITDAQLANILPKNPVTGKIWLPATELTSSCYSNMFSGCTSLTQAPELPALTLKDYCYHSMFSGCTGLVSVSKLPAIALENHCYWGMFQECTQLSSLQVAFMTWGISDNTYNWLSGVAATGTFKCPAALDTTTKDASHVPVGWTVDQ